MVTTKTETTTKNRRKYVRIPTNCRISAEKILFSAKADTETLGEARNIGAGGLLFVAEREYHSDDLFKLTITIPRWKEFNPTALGGDSSALHQPMTAICQVTRSRQLPDGGYEIAAKFVNVYEEDKVDLERFIKEKAKQSEVSILRAVKSGL
jgi:hypothetical protein